MIKKLINKITNVSVAALFLASISTQLVSVFLMPQAAFAISGSGGAEDPYVITTCAELQALDNLESARQDDVYSLGNNIDCSMTNPSDPDFNPSGTWSDEQGFDPISNLNVTFDGKGHTISGLFIDRNNGAYVGLFEQMPRVVTNLHIDSTSYFQGASNTGSIAGSGYNFSIFGVTSAATVRSSGGPLGGLIGESNGDGNKLNHDSFTGTITNTGSNTEVGGLIGRSYYGFDINESYVQATITGGNAIGGIIGNSGYSGTCGSRVMANVYAAGIINSGGSGYAGGLFGQFESNCPSNTKQIINTFSVMEKGTGNAVYGGIIGANSSSVQVANTYFDQTNMATPECLGSTSGTPDISTCIPVNTDGSDGSRFVDTTEVEPFAGSDGWDFENTWQTAPGLPVLRAYVPLSGPSAVTNLTLTPLSEAQVQLTFDPTEDWGPGQPEGYYIYQAKESSKEWTDHLIEDTSIGTSTSSVATTNLPSTSIDVRVAPISAYGRGPWVSATVTTLPKILHQISSCADLQAIDDTMNQGSLDTYVLAQDIDCTGVDFVPIGNDSEGWQQDVDFRGTLDGQGHSISNLEIIKSQDYSVGLFYRLNHAVIKNLTLSSGYVLGNETVGSLAGYSDNGGLISNVTSNLAVASVDNMGDNVGGLIGSAVTDVNGGLTIQNSAFNGEVSGNNYVGGLVGYMSTYEQENTTVDNSYTTGTITASGSSTGGLIGYSDVESGGQGFEGTTGLYINNSYSQIDILSSDGAAGGLVGETYFYNIDNSPTILNVQNSYSVGEITANDYASGIVGFVNNLSNNQAIEINDSFASNTGLENGPNYALVGGSDFVDGGSLTFSNSYFDHSRVDDEDVVIGPDQAAYDFYLGATAITETGYFLGNNLNHPMSDWDFDTIWKTVDASYPVFHSVSDIDTDGSPNAAEQSAPNDGDANGDGYNDAYQNNVTSYVNPVTGKYAVVQTSCDANSNIKTENESAGTGKDAVYDYPAGLVDFTGVSCDNPDVTVTQYYFGTFDASKISIRKLRNGTYITITGTVLSNVIIGSQPALKVVYHIIDGGPLDDDGLVNGTIRDPSGPAVLAISAPNTGIHKVQK